MISLGSQSSLFKWLGAVLLALFITPALAQNFQTKAKQALLMDYESGTVLYQKNADQLMPPASMAKLMTMEVVFNAIKTGELDFDTPFRISADVCKKIETLRKAGNLNGKQGTAWHEREIIHCKLFLATRSVTVHSHRPDKSVSNDCKPVD